MKRRFGSGILLIFLVGGLAACVRGPSDASDQLGSLTRQRSALSETPAFVQSGFATPQTPQGSVSVTFTGAQAPGNFIAVLIGWSDTTAQVTSVSDTSGNTYQSALSPTVRAGELTHSIYYSKNIAAAAAGANTVTVAFSQAAIFPDVRVLEYSGIDRTAPLDVAAGATGSSATSSSGTVTTTHADDLLVAGNVVMSSTGSAGNDFVTRVTTTPNGNVAADRVVSAIGSYGATGSLSGADSWVMQMAAFRAATVSDDTQPPTAPAGLTATASSSTQVSLAWTAATDDVGVTSHLVERCQGAGCSSFAQVGSAPGATFSDTALAAATSYSYRVRARDAAGNLGVFSNGAAAMTSTAASAAPAYVQGGYAVPQTAQATVTATYAGAQAAGNLNIVVVGWWDASAHVSSVTDSAGNTYALAVGPTIISGTASQSIYYAKSIASSVAGANAVTVAFDQPAPYVDVRVVEYSGVDSAAPLDVVAASQGTGTTSSTEAVTTTNALDLLVAANIVETGTTGPGSGFAQRLLTTPNGDLVEDRVVSATGSYSATAPLITSGAWIMQMAAFKAASSTPPAPDQCHTAGSCDPATGSCSYPPKANGTACSDGNLCTQTDTCHAGRCTGAAELQCPGDACRAPGTCDPGTGLCTSSAISEGGSCSDGNRCSLGDNCHAGSCIPGTTEGGCAATGDTYYVPVTGLGSTQGASYATDINNAGEVVGADSRTNYAAIYPGAVTTQGFRWTEAEGMVPIPAEAGMDVFPKGINTAGVIAGTAVAHASAGRSAFRFTRPTDTTIQYLATPGGTVMGINDAGQIGGSAYFAGLLRMFRTQAAAVQVIEGPAGDLYQNAYAIDPLGGIVGATTRPSGAAAAIRYTDTLGIQYLNDLIPGASGWDLDPADGEADLAIAYGTNGSQVVGWGYHGNGLKRAFRLTPDAAPGQSEIRELGMIPAFAADSPYQAVVAHDVNAAGAIAGAVYEQNVFTPVRAFVWVEGTGIIDLNDLIDPDSDWVLAAAFAINDSRDVVGLGYLDNQPRAFKMRVPDLSPCPAADQCHAAGVRDLRTGACSAPMLANGTSCDDGLACSPNDTCQDGACVGTVGSRVPPIPSLECVAATGSGRYAAIFGYDNTANTVNTRIPAGDDNWLSLAHDESSAAVFPPEWFKPGIQRGALVVPFSAGETVSWDVACHTATASISSPACTMVTPELSTGPAADVGGKAVEVLALPKTVATQTSYVPADVARDEALAQAGEPPIGPTAVGTLEGQFAVTDDGDARYEIPIDVSPGRNGMQPSLRLVYSSRGANGPLGPGWSLAGLSRIARCPRTPAVALLTEQEAAPVLFEPTDELCLDGERLVRVGPGSGHGEYRTERDSFAKVVVVGEDALGPTQIDVYRKDGRIESYGTDASSRMEMRQVTPPAVNDTNIVPLPYPERTVRAAWGMSRVVDRFENTMTISYATVLDTPFGPRDLGHEIAPVELRYASNPRLGQPALRSVKLRYNVRTHIRSDVAQLYQSGVATIRDPLLEQIDVTGPNPIGEALLWSYRLYYASPSISKRPLLSRIQRCDAAGACQAPTTFAWEAGDLTFRSVSTSIGDAHNFLFDYGNAQPYQNASRMIQALDVDGDGRDDLLYRANIPPTTTGSVALLSDADWTLRFSGGNTFGPPLVTDLPPPAFDQKTYFSYPHAMPADFNGDGRMDVALLERNISGGPERQLWHLFRSAGPTGFVRLPNGLSGDDYTDPAINPEYDRRTTRTLPLVVSDLDGDGLTELLRGLTVDSEPTYFPGNVVLGIRPFTTTGAEPYQPLRLQKNGFTTQLRDSSKFVSDIDGDGRSELIAVAGDLVAGVYDHRYSAITIGRDGLGRSKLTTLRALAGSAPAINKFADVNGDRLPDAITQDWVDNTQFTYLWRNLGTGFAQGTSVDNRVLDGIAVDFNEDGMQDFLVVGCAKPGTIQTHPIVLLSRGFGLFEERELTEIPLGAAINQYFGPHSCLSAVLDVDGDGRMDIVQAEPGNPQLQLHIRNGRQADRITTVRDGLGKSISIEYKVAESPVSECAAPRRCLRKRVDAVSAYEVDNGTTGPAAERRNRFTFTYGTPVSDSLGRGWLGFVSRTKRDVRTGAFEMRIFNNQVRMGTSYPFAGLLRTEVFEVTLASGRKLRRTRDTEYEIIVGDPAAGVPYAVRPNLVTEMEWEREADAGDYDLQHPQRWIETITTFDSYGNLTTREVRHKNAGTVELFDATYDDPNTDNWLVSKILSTHTASISATGERQDRNVSYDVDAATGAIRSQTVEPNGGTDERLVTTYWPNRAGQITVVTRTDQLGTTRTEKIAYDDVDVTFPATIVNAEGHMTRLVYHGGLGVLAARVDPNGTTARWRYDGLGRVTQQSPGDGSALGLIYGRPAEGEAASSMMWIREGGGTGVISFDAMGREVATSDARFGGGLNRRMTTTTYDPVSGQRASISRPFEGAPTAMPAFVTTFAYDALRRLTAVSPAGEAVVTFDHAGLKTSIARGGVQKQYRVTDERGRIVRTVSFEPTSTTGEIGTTYDHGPYGLLRHVTHDSESRVLTLHYDVLGRRTLLEDPDAGNRETRYNAFGEVRREADGDGRETLYPRDLLGRARREEAAGRVDSFVWDSAPNGLGALASSTSGWGVETRYAYDEHGRQRSASLTIAGETFVVDNGFDSLGRLSTITYPAVGAAPRLTVSFGYDVADGSMASVTAQNPTMNVWAKTAEASDGQLSGEAFGNGEQTVRHFDGATGRIRHISTGTGSLAFGLSGFPELENSVQNLLYGYRPDGKMETRTDLVLGAHEGFTYDNVDRIKTWTPRSGTTVTYDYGDLGNLTGRHYQEVNGLSAHEVFAYDDPLKPHAITSGPWGSYTYDGSGRQRSRPGQPQVDYTTFDLPESIQHEAGTTTFAFDATHKRVLKQGPAATTVYVGGLYERRTDVTGVSHAFYLPGRDGFVGQLVCAETSGGPTCGQPSYFHDDHLKSLDTLTIDAASVVHIKRDPFGRYFDPANPGSTGAPGSTAVRLGFTGEEQDDELGLVNLNHRLYDPRTGRFISPDPLVADPHWGQAYNRYTYVLNNPLSFIDPSGLQSQPPADQIMDWENPPPPDPGYHVSSLRDGGPYNFDQMTNNVPGADPPILTTIPLDGPAPFVPASTGVPVSVEMTSSGVPGQGGGSVGQPLPHGANPDLGHQAAIPAPPQGEGETELDYVNRLSSSNPVLSVGPGALGAVTTKGAATIATFGGGALFRIITSDQVRNWTSNLALGLAPRGREVGNRLLHGGLSLFDTLTGAASRVPVILPGLQRAGHSVLGIAELRGFSPTLMSQLVKTLGDGHWTFTGNPLQLQLHWFQSVVRF